MENLIDIMKMVEAIEKMEVFFEMSDCLFQRCVSYARWNFSSWQVILKILMKKKEDAQLIFKILKNLRDQSKATVR